MPHLIILILLTVFLYIWLKKKICQSLLKKENNYRRLKEEYDKASKENARLAADNAGLGLAAEETIALYDITKKICGTLDEEKIFDIFKSFIKKYTGTEECKLLGKEENPAEYKDYTVFPLMLHKQTIGYLAAGGIEEKDADKFHILAHQFLLGTKRAFLYKQIQELTIIDSLTQVFNRRYFLERFAEELERSRKYSYNLSFLMLDIDYFKSYNDSYGHLVGDVILKEISKTIKETARQVDFIGRYGGEEFSIILSETDRAKAVFAAERFRRAVEAKQIRAYDENLNVTISIGVSVFPEDAAEQKALIDKADKALYRAKQEGRNKVCSV